MDRETLIRLLLDKMIELARIGGHSKAVARLATAAGELSLRPEFKFGGGLVFDLRIDRDAVPEDGPLPEVEAAPAAADEVDPEKEVLPEE